MTTDTLHYIEIPLCTRTDKERERDKTLWNI